MNQIGTSAAIICPSVEFDEHLDRAWEIYEQNWIRMKSNLYGTAAYLDTLLIITNSSLL